MFQDPASQILPLLLRDTNIIFHLSERKDKNIALINQSVELVRRTRTYPWILYFFLTERRAISEDYPEAGDDMETLI